MFTPEELERRAYIEGDVKLAAVYAEMLDSQELLEQNEALELTIDDLKIRIVDLETAILELT